MSWRLLCVAMDSGVEPCAQEPRTDRSPPTIMEGGVGRACVPPISSRKHASQQLRTTVGARFVESLHDIRESVRSRVVHWRDPIIALLFDVCGVLDKGQNDLVVTVQRSSYT